MANTSGKLGAMIHIKTEDDNDIVKAKNFDIVTDPKSLRYQLNEGDFYKDRFFHRLGLAFDSDEKMKSMVDSIGKESIHKMCVALANLSTEELDEIINSNDEELNREAFTKLVMAANQLFYFFKTGDEILQTRVDRQVTNVENVETAVAFNNYVKSEQAHLEKLDDFNRALDNRVESFTDEAEKQDVKRFAVWVRDSINEIKNSQTGKNLQIAGLQATVNELEAEAAVVPVVAPTKKKTLKQIAQAALAVILVGGALGIGVLLGNSKAADKLRELTNKIKTREEIIDVVKAENDDLKKTIEGQDLTLSAWEKRAKELNDENSAYRRAFPDTADTNKDGVVSPEEGAEYIRELLENGLTQADLEAAKDAIREEYEARLAELENQLAKSVSQEEYDELANKYNDLRKKYNNVLDDLEDLGNRVHELENLNDAKDHTIAILEDELARALDGHDDPAYIAELEQKIADLQDENASKDDIINALQEQLDKATTPEEKAALEQRIADLEASNAEKDETIASLREQLADTTDAEEIARLQQRIADLENENESLKAEKDDILNKYLELLDEVDNNYQEVSDGKTTGGNEAVNASDQNTDNNGNPTDDNNHGGPAVGQKTGEDEEEDMQN